MEDHNAVNGGGDTDVVELPDMWQQVTQPAEHLRIENEALKEEVEALRVSKEQMRQALLAKQESAMRAAAAADAKCAQLEKALRERSEVAKEPESERERERGSLQRVREELKEVQVALGKEMQEGKVVRQAKEQLLAEKALLDKKVASLMIELCQVRNRERERELDMERERKAEREREREREREKEEREREREREKEEEREREREREREVREREREARERERKEERERERKEEREKERGREHKQRWETAAAGPGARENEKVQQRAAAEREARLREELEWMRSELRTLRAQIAFHQQQEQQDQQHQHQHQQQQQQQQQLQRQQQRGPTPPGSRRVWGFPPPSLLPGAGVKSVVVNGGVVAKRENGEELEEALGEVQQLRRHVSQLREDNMRLMAPMLASETREKELKELRARVRQLEGGGGPASVHFRGNWEGGGSGGFTGRPAAACRYQSGNQTYSRIAAPSDPRRLDDGGLRQKFRRQ